MQYILCLFLCFISIPLLANPPIFIDSIEDAISISQDLNMPIITIVSADWCHYCMKLEKTISDNLEVLDDIIVLKLDFDENSEFVKKHRIKKIPTIIYQNEKYVGKYNIVDLKKILGR
jgi:thiol-disulfide isomerase/thioredoxin